MSIDKVKVLLVDGQEGRNQLLESVLVSLSLDIVITDDEKAAIALARKISPGVIFIDTTVRQSDKLALVSLLKDDGETRTIPVVVLTDRKETAARLTAMESGVDDLLIKPLDEIEIRVRINSWLEAQTRNERLRHYESGLAIKTTDRTRDLERALEKVKTASLDTVYRLSCAAEYKDEETGTHIERMSHYATAIARRLGLDSEVIEDLLWASPMHDIGKIGIPDQILQKPGKLDPDEWATVKQHTVIGASILKDSDTGFIRLAEEIALSHHEKWDGSGYPNRLNGTDIPLAGRIVGLADVFDALTSKRPYKSPMSLEEAFAIVTRDRGSHFDPEVVDAFFAIQDEIISEYNWWQFIS